LLRTAQLLFLGSQRSD